MSGSQNRLELKNDRAGSSVPPMQVHYQRLFRICSSFHITSLNPQLVACEQLIGQRDTIRGGNHPDASRYARRRTQVTVDIIGYNHKQQEEKS